MTAEEFYKDHFGHTSQHVSMDKIFVCMEFSLPNDILLRNLYDAWSYGLIPKFGKLIVGEEEPYKYLVDSIRTFPSPEEFNDMIMDAGFKKTTIKQLSGNIVCIYRAEKI